MAANVPLTIAIDPGYDRVGWAVGSCQRGQFIINGYGLIQTNKTQTIFERYSQVETELETILLTYRPQQAAMESLFFSKNQTTAMRVAEVRGLLLASLLRHQITCYEYNPGSIKLAITGYGKADKKAVEKMVRLELKLESEKLIDDTLDALAILVTHATTML